METPAALEKLARRASSLVAYWHEGGIALENYLSRRRIVVQPVVLHLISQFDEFAPLAEIESKLTRLANAGDILPALLEHNLLVLWGSELDLKEQHLASWNWGHDARFFHYSTKDVEYTFDFDAIRVHLEAKAKESPPPSPFKRCNGPTVALPDAKSLHSSLQDALINRRTVRNYLREQISAMDLASILFWTWGKQRFFNDSQLDRRIIKTSPSGGARHPIEVYLAVQRVRGLDAGIYHYSVEDHCLELMQRGLFEQRMVDLFSGQYWVRDAAVLFFMTAVLPRSMWKYDHSRAYRVVQLDAGHLGQTFHLVCSAIGLGPFTTAALQDSEIEKTLCIDGVNEVAVYAAATGLPVDVS